MDISVIIPTFNRRQVLPRAVRSVLGQKTSGIRSLKIIIADDGSRDGSRALIEQEFPSLTYLHWETQKGPSFARNQAVKHARGEWLAFLDSDDEWKPSKLQEQVHFFRENPDYRICQTDEIWIRNGVRVNAMKKHEKHGGWIFEHCLPLCVISPSAVMLEKKLFNEVGGFDESLPACEDYDLWLRISSKYPVGLIPKKCVLKYGGHADQRSREFPAMDRFRVRALEKILTSGELSPEKESQAVRTLDQKTRILLAGALKRGHSEEAESLMSLRSKYIPETVR